MNRKSEFSTVALVAVTANVPLSAIAYELVHCLNVIGSSALVQVPLRCTRNLDFCVPFPFLGTKLLNEPVYPSLTQSWVEPVFFLLLFLRCTEKFKMFVLRFWYIFYIYRFYCKSCLSILKKFNMLYCATFYVCTVAYSILVRASILMKSLSLLCRHLPQMPYILRKREKIRWGILH